MVPAARPLNCWNTIERTRVSKTGSRYWMRQGPTRSMISRSTGAAFLRWRMAFRIGTRCRVDASNILMKASISFVLGLLLVFPAVAQEPTIKVDVDIVNVLCTVRTKSGGLVGNLKKEDFTLFENGQKQDIKYFTRETDIPLTI